MHFARSTYPHRSAFTLIELLTVIAIIGILAAIIIPTVGRVRESARNSTSLSNLRQIGMANQLFAQDNKGLTVPGKAPLSAALRVQWQVLLSKYTEGRQLAGDWEINAVGSTTKTIFNEPKWTSGAPGYQEGAVYESGYGLNMNPLTPNDPQGNMEWSENESPKARVPLAKIADPSQRILAAVWVNWNMYPTTSITQTELVQSSERYTSRKINVAYFDAHVGSLTTRQFHTAIIRRAN